MNNIKIYGSIDYDTYIMTKKEKMYTILTASIFLFAIGYIFYHSIILSILICPLAIFYPKYKKKEIINMRKNELKLQFNEMLYSLSSSISAGRSLELSFKDVLKDLSIIYPDSGTYIISEVQIIVGKIDMNQTVEEVLEDFSNRAHIEDIENFVDVLKTCKRTGGNTVEIIKNTSNIISDKIEITQEIETLLAQRKFEQKVLNILPIILILLLTYSANDYMSPVFEGVIGRIVMSISIMFLLVSYFISKKIMDIKI